MRLDLEIGNLIFQYGHRVTVERGKDTGETLEVSAILQWVKGTGEQLAPSPLAVHDSQKILYLGEAGVQLEAGRDEVLWEGRRYRVLSAHPVLSGSHIAYCRGVLKEKEVACHENGGF